MSWVETLKPGDRVMAVRKAMGLERGEKVHPLGEIEIVSVRREALHRLWCPEYGPADAAREGYPEADGYWFVSHFCAAMRCTPDTEVTRIEFRRVG